MNLFLSRLFINQRSRRAMSEMLHPYEMHRTLMRAFPEAEEGARNAFGVLFRAEEPDRAGAIKVYVQSLVEPDWTFMETLEDYLDYDAAPSPYEHKNIMPFCERIRSGDRFAFRLRANPTKRVSKQDDPMRGKRVELNREEEQLAWLARKGKERGKGVQGGFDLVSTFFEDEAGERVALFHASAKKEGKLTGRKRLSETGHRMTHLAVLFEGVLDVTDADAFRETLILGIGSAKAFGFGLLSLAPSK